VSALRDGRGDGLDQRREAAVGELKAHPAPRSPWPLVWLLYLSGLLAAAQLGKMSALAPLVASALGLSLTTVGIAISLIEIGGATLGAVAGLFAHRLGLRRTLRWGVAFLALAGLGGASAHGAVGLLGWRLLEAAGYLGVIVSAPVLIAHHAGAAGARVQGLALTLWATFVPVGLALGAWASASAAATWDWRVAMAAGGAVGVVLWTVLWRADLPEHADAPGIATVAPGARLTPALWCLTLGFGAFALFGIGVLGLLPTLLVREVGLSAQAAGQWTAIASVSAIAGSATTASLLRHGIGVRWPIMVSLGLPPLLLFGVFTDAPRAEVAIGLAIALNMVGGVFASLGFALLPRLATAPGQMVRANGLLAQCGASGSLLGPPTMAACVQAGGWTAAAVLGLIVSLVALPLAWRAVSAARPPAH
jgi:CP family cyanate transporter-like MFS transporter